MIVSRPRSIIALILTAAVFIGGAVSLSVSAAQSDRNSSTSSKSIWGNKKPAGVVLDSDRKSVELGTTFTPAVDGNVSAIRFYKVAGQTGSHTGSIWADGTRIATVTFKNESATGWQSASLTKPVALKSGKSYVVSYRVPAGGRYAATTNFSGESKSSSVTVSQRNSGIYTYAKTGSSPDSRWRSSQYWADVTFVPTGADKVTEPGTTTPTATPTAAETPTAPPVPVRSPTPTLAPTPAPAPPSSSSTTGFPTRTSAGLPSGWQPTKQVTGNYYVRTAGAIVEDLRVSNGAIIIEAANVTVRRVQMAGSSIINGAGSTCFPGLLVEDSEFTPNGTTTDQGDAVIQFGGYTARNIVIDGVPEGLRVGGSDINCGPVSVIDSFIRIKSPDVCKDWHGDGIQGYGGNKLTVRNTTIFMLELNGCTGTAAFFYPKNQGNTSVDIDGLLLGGSSGYPFRNGMPGSVKNLKIVEGSWGYGPVDVNCSVLTVFQAQIVKLDAAGQPVSTGKSVACTGVGN